MLSNIQKVWKKDNIGVDISQQWALIDFATELEDAADEGRAELVDGYIRQMPEAELSSGFRDALVGTDQDNFNRLSE